jgi:hypothetical protein
LSLNSSTIPKRKEGRNQGREGIRNKAKEGGGREGGRRRKGGKDPTRI